MSHGDYEVTEEALQLARKLMFETWSDAYAKIKFAVNFEAIIMDEANDLAEFCVEADTRTATILLVSFLEDAIKKVFVEYWKVKTRQAEDRYFGGNGPLSTFSQRALVAKGMSWITAEQSTELDVVRKIRNNFAHDHRIHSLTEIKMSSLIARLDNREQTWCQLAGYKKAHDLASDETIFRMRVFCCGMFNVSRILKSAKLQRSEIPIEFRPDPSWSALLEIEQGLIDAAMKYCWLSLGLGYSGAAYQYRRERKVLGEDT